jgi:hypothetical protein
VKKIVEAKALAPNESKNRQQQLYKDLCLALTAQKTKTAEELSRVHKGKKSIKAYRNNI